MTAFSPGAEQLLRDLAPQVLGAVTRRYRDFAACEDAVQEALVAASQQWPRDGVPDNPRGWLIHVASRRMIDQIRSDGARRQREHEAALDLGQVVAAAHMASRADEDETLTLLFMFESPAPRARAERLGTVLHVLYLIFNEGYTASAGSSLHRVDLSTEAIRLTRAVRQLIPDDTEVAGLLALMRLADARRLARTGPAGELISCRSRTVRSGTATPSPKAPRC